MLLAAAPANATDKVGDLAAPLEASADLDRNVFFFGGRFSAGSLGQALMPGSVPYEDNYFLGAGYQQMLLRTDYGLTFGYEVGIGARLAGHGENSSAELWGGGVARYQGWDLFNTFHIAPSLTLGLSYVTDGIGLEKEKAKTAPKPIRLLVYMAPEIAVSTLDNPDTEYFLRVQHRSGGLGLIMSFDGSNALSVGVRLKF